MPTKQETFDTVARHLLTQRRVALNDQGTCAYRGVDETKCAAGVLIPDEEYLPDFECKAVAIAGNFADAPRPTDVGRVIQRLGHDLTLVRSLQKIHDSLRVCEWGAALRALADEMDLDPAVVRELRP